MKKFYVIGIVLMVLLVAVACGGKKDSADRWLDSYEEVVVSYENMGSDISMTDVVAISQKFEELNANDYEFDLTSSQQKRLEKLVKRLTKVMEKFGN